MSKYHLVQEPAIGADQNAPPVSLGRFEEYEPAALWADNHNRTHGPGLRVYVVPEELMWTDEEVNAS